MYDSLHTRFPLDPVYTRLLLKYLQDEYFDQYGSDLDVSDWDITTVPDGVPQQRGYDDCGVFTCAFLLYLVIGRVRD